MRGPQPFTKAAWGMFTGSYSYKSIAGMALGPASLVKFLGPSLEKARGVLHKGESLSQSPARTPQKGLDIG
jgi:hypothetical protein